MVHFTCDLCGNKIREERYTVDIQVAAAFDPDELTAEHLDEDHLLLIAQEIELLDSTADFSIEQTGPKKLKFDLCYGCCQNYLKSPLQRQAVGRPNFSHN